MKSSMGTSKIKILRTVAKPPHIGLDVVAFGKVEHLCSEDAGAIKIHFVRRGLWKGDVSFEWKTENVNVIADSYYHLHGTVTMREGEKSKSVEIQIDDNDVWNMEAVQLVHMHSPENCVLGELSTTTVVILNEDIFPSDCTETESEFKMVKGFINHMTDYFPTETRWGLLFRIYPAISFLCVSLVMLISINIVINDGLKGEEYRLNMFLLAAAFLINVLLGNIAAERFNELRIGGKAKAHLRTAVLNVNLQLTLPGQEEFTSGDVLNLMGSGIEQCISMVWGNLFALWQHTLVLLFMIGLMFYTLRNVMWMSVFPLSMIVFDVCVFFYRAPEQIEKFAKFMDEERDWKATVIEATDLRTCITTYRAGATLCGQFKAIHQEANAANWQQGTNFMRTQWMVKWFHSVLIFAVFILIVEKVVDGDVKIGSFAVLMGTLFKFDGQVLLIFTSMFQMVNGFTWIRMLSRMLNSETRRVALLQASERRERLVNEFDKALSGEGNDISETDISCIEAEFTYMSNDEQTKPFTFGPLSLVIEPGGIIAVRTAHRGGKQTFLKMLGRVLLPTNGFIYYPDNLRARYLSDQPQLFNMTILQNLQFGNKKVIPEDEIWKVCDSLGIGHLKQWKGNIGNAGKKLASSEQALISLARALLSSVDILLLANTLDNFDANTRTKVFEVLTQMVANRGLDYDIPEGSSLASRKPKTVFFITHYKELENMAQHITNLDKVDQFDTNGDGKLNPMEMQSWKGSMGDAEKDLTAVMKRQGVGMTASKPEKRSAVVDNIELNPIHTEAHVPKESDKELHTLFVEVDTNGSGAIDHNELLLIFEKFVVDKSVIEGDSSGHSAVNLTSAMIDSYGTNGVLNFEEFRAMIHENDLWPVLETLARETAVSNASPRAKAVLNIYQAG